MAKYKVWVCLEETYYDVEADSEEEAFQIASDAAMYGSNWSWDAELIEDDEDDEGEE